MVSNTDFLAIDLGCASDLTTVTDDLRVLPTGLGSVAEPNINTSVGNDQIATFGDFCVCATPREASVDIDSRIGNDNAVLLEGPNVEPCRADTRFSLGSGNNQLTFNGDMQELYLPAV